jgi:hypothetical protein
MRILLCLLQLSLLLLLLLLFPGERRIILVAGFGGLEAMISSPSIMLTSMLIDPQHFDATSTAASVATGVFSQFHASTSFMDNTCSSSSLTLTLLSSSSSVSSSLSTSIPIATAKATATSTAGAAYYSYYTHALATHPLLTKMATGAVLAVAGDAIAQRCRPGDACRPLGYDVKRATAFCLFDVSYRAVQHYLYPPLIQHFHGQYVMAAVQATVGAFAAAEHAADSSNNNMIQLASSALEQSLVSQLAIIPTLYYPVFFIVTGAVQGLTLDQTIARAQETFIPLMKRNLLFWIPVVCIHPSHCHKCWSFWRLCKNFRYSHKHCKKASSTHLLFFFFASFFLYAPLLTCSNFWYLALSPRVYKSPS